MTRRVLAALVILVGILAGFRYIDGGTSQNSPEDLASPVSTPVSSHDAARDDAARGRQLLAEVPVKGRAPKADYSRADFGRGWKVLAGCDARNRTLARDLTDVTYKPGTHDCVVQSGVLQDPYTGAAIRFQRGNQTSTLVQIDHVYPLFLAHQQGAQQWTQGQREAFASDPLNLVATSGQINQAKGASGPGSWLPPNKGYRCAYVVRFTAVTHKYRLSMNPGDHRAAERVLARC